jgi:hypothetical protein
LQLVDLRKGTQASKGREFVLSFFVLTIMVLQPTGNWDLE